MHPTDAVDPVPLCSMCRHMYMQINFPFEKRCTPKCCKSCAVHRKKKTGLKTKRTKVQPTDAVNPVPLHSMCRQTVHVNKFPLPEIGAPQVLNILPYSWKTDKTSLRKKDTGATYRFC
jgi:hypothetical protein